MNPRSVRHRNSFDAGVKLILPRFCALVLAMCLATPLAAAETLKILVGFPAGSGLDVITRTIAERVRIDTARTIIVDNRGGSGGRIAAEALAKSEPNGNTLLAAPIVTTAFSPFVFKRLGFDPLKDLAPVTRLGTFKFALAVNKDVPVDSVEQFIAYTRANPGKMNYGSLSAGTPSHFLGAMFGRSTGIDLKHVPYRGSGPATIGLLGAEVQAVFNTTAAMMPLYQDKQVKLLAVTGAERSPVLPDVPTFRELKLGLGDIEAAELWYGFFAPGGTPDTVIREHAAVIGQALRDPDVRARLKDLDIDVVIDTPEEFAKIVAADYDRWGRIIRETGFTLSE
jgi:tripartite-type tricarboxylate transporter receptor subunit TctC